MTKCIAIITVVLFQLVTFGATAGVQGAVKIAQTEPGIPQQYEGTPSDPDMWRYLRQGGTGRSDAQDHKARRLIQSSSERWRLFLVERLPDLGAWLLAGMCGLLTVFYMARGRIRIQAGFSPNLILRFGFLERFAHWLLAVSFLVLAVTGLNMMYGSEIVKPLIGYTQFATVTGYGKMLHDYTGFSFMAGLLLIVVIWIRDNFPDRSDLVWLARGGGLFSRHEHPPARRFNAGQKIVFWFVVLAGALVSFSGLCLMFPFTFAPFANTFAALNMLGAELPTDLTAVTEMQLTLIWHGALGVVMIAVIIAHIYVGSIGMEGAFDAMATGHVDENWAHQHHSEWARNQEISERPVIDSSASGRTGRATP